MPAVPRLADRVLAVQRAGGGAVDWSPTRTLRLAAQDRLYVIATRAGLSRVLAGSQAPRGPTHPPQIDAVW